MRHAGPAERIGKLQPARSAANDDHRVFAGRMDGGYVRQLVAFWSLRASAFSIR
jgi:hypothetical protein